MPTNLIIGYGFDGKSAKEQKAQTDEAEERGSVMLGPTGSNRKRRDKVLAILDRFIRDGVKRYNAVYESRPRPAKFEFSDGTLVKRLDVANQMWRNMQMGGKTPTDLDLNQLEHSYYVNDEDDGDY